MAHRSGAPFARTCLAVAVVLLLLPIHLPLGMEAPPATAAALEPLRVVQGVIQPGTSLARALDGVLSPAQLHRLVQAASPAYDLSRVAVGQPFGLALDAADGLVAFTYRIDELSTLRVMSRDDELQPEILERRYDTALHRAEGVIESSLFMAITASGEKDQLALDLAEIFAWDVDFNTEIQKGDSFRVVVEKLSLEGEFSRYGRILTAEFVRGERVHRAVRFEGGERPGYYAPDGTPLRKAFLRSPLRFTRISSRFTRRRLHPVTGQYRPHLAVDYAAPTGTPVHASADGRVVAAGWMGGLGKAVHLRHANGFETLYGHLSRIHVRRGQRVAQGTPVGNVGATGLATGPHLDYRMKRDGQYVNPLAVQLPPAEPIPESLFPDFERRRDAALALLDESPSSLLHASR